MLVYIAQTNLLTVVGVCDTAEGAMMRLRGKRLVEDKLGGWDVFGVGDEKVGLITVHDVRTT